MGEWIDQVAKTLASGIPRREALKRIAGGLAGMAAAAAIPPAAAQAQGGPCPSGQQVCPVTGACQACPGGQIPQPNSAGNGCICACAPGETACTQTVRGRQITSCCSGTAPVCVSGTCRPCSPAGQQGGCPQNQICQPNGSCGCANNAQCPAGQVCIAGACQACANAGQCGAGFACVAGVCTACNQGGQQVCGANGQFCCQNNQACVNNACVPCANPNQFACGPVGNQQCCNLGQVCVNNACQNCGPGGAPCANNTTCCTGTTPICAGGVVCQQCNPNGGGGPPQGNCPAGQVCAATGACVQCLSNAQCSGNTPICQNNTCVACGGNFGSGGPTACPAATAAFCNNGACVPCTNSSQCPANAAVCNAGTCQACTANFGGGAGACPTAQLPFCNAGTCSPCTSGAQCPASTPVCDSGVCEGCQFNLQCQTPNQPNNTNPVCVNGQCTACPGGTPVQCGNAGSIICCPTATCCNGASNTPTCCTGATPFCNPATQICQASQTCTNNTQCAGTPTTPICANGQCVPCTGDFGSPAGPANPNPCPTAPPGASVCVTTGATAGACVACPVCAPADTLTLQGRLTFGVDPLKNQRVERQFGTGNVPSCNPAASSQATCTPFDAPATLYDLWRLRNTQPCPSCVTVTLTTSCSEFNLNPDGIYVAAYLNNYNPSNNLVCQNYIGSPGDSPNDPISGTGNSVRFSFTVPANTDYFIVVEEIDPMPTTCAGYVLTVACPGGASFQSPAPINNRRASAPYGASGPKTAADRGGRTGPRKEDN